MLVRIFFKGGSETTVKATEVHLITDVSESRYVLTLSKDEKIVAQFNWLEITGWKAE